MRERARVCILHHASEIMRRDINWEVRAPLPVVGACGKHNAGFATWDVPYAPGNITLTAFDAARAPVATLVSVTAGPPAALSAAVEWLGSSPEKCRPSRCGHVWFDRGARGARRRHRASLD